MSSAFKRIIIMILMFHFCFVSFQGTFSATTLPVAYPEIDNDKINSTELIHYIALGDSLAVGITSDNKLGKSYSDFLAKRFQSLNRLATFNKGFAGLNYTTDDVLNDIQMDVERDVFGIGFDEMTVNLRESLKQANVITMSAGANDILTHVQVNETTKSISINETGLERALKQIQINYAQIVSEIEQLNPEAQLFVMGYYNSFPYLGEDAQPILKQLLEFSLSKMKKV